MYCFEIQGMILTLPHLLATDQNLGQTEESYDYIVKCFPLFLELNEISRKKKYKKCIKTWEKWEFIWVDENVWPRPTSWLTLKVTTSKWYKKSPQICIVSFVWSWWEILSNLNVAMECVTSASNPCSAALNKSEFK